MASVTVANSDPDDIQHELNELTEQILCLLFLSDGDCTEKQLEQYSWDLTHVLRYARAMGYHAAFLWKDGGIAIEWQPLQAGVQ
jgi:hypothetical protein